MPKSPVCPHCVAPDASSIGTMRGLGFKHEPWMDWCPHEQGEEKRPDIMPKSPLELRDAVDRTIRDLLETMQDRYDRAEHPFISAGLHSLITTLDRLRDARGELDHVVHHCKMP